MAYIAPRYYDVDDFLSQEDLVPVSTNLDFISLGHLKKDLDTRDLPENTRLLLPVWALGKWTKNKFVKLRIPKRYAQPAREAIVADPLNYEVTANYFSTGKAIAALSGHSENEAAQLRETLLKTLDWSLCNSRGEDVSDFFSKLTSEERRLYQVGSNKRRRLQSS